MRIAVIGPRDDLAAAVTCTGEASLEPPAGVQTVTPVVLAVHVVPEVVPTVMVNGVLKTDPPEFQACTTTLCVPALTARLTSRLAALVRYADTLSI